MADDTDGPWNDYQPWNDTSLQGNDAPTQQAAPDDSGGPWNDYKPWQDPQFQQQQDQPDLPPPESALGYGIRRAAHAFLPGVAGAGAGGAVFGPATAAAAPFVGPFAPLVGGAAAIGAGMITSFGVGKAQSAGADLLGIDDSAQIAADEEAGHGLAGDVGDFMGSMGGMKPDLNSGLRLGERALGGGLMAGIEGVQQYRQGKFDPAAIALAAAGGAASKPNKLGQATEDMFARNGGKAINAVKGWVPGRPGQQANAAAGGAQTAANPANAAANSAAPGVAQSSIPPNTSANTTANTGGPAPGAPGSMGTTTGNRNAGKQTAPANTAAVTTGDPSAGLAGDPTVTAAAQLSAGVDPADSMLVGGSGAPPAAQKTTPPAAGQGVNPNGASQPTPPVKGGNPQNSGAGIPPTGAPNPNPVQQPLGMPAKNVVSGAQAAPPQREPGQQASQNGPAAPAPNGATNAKTPAQPALPAPEHVEAAKQIALDKGYVSPSYLQRKLAEKFPGQSKNFGLPTVSRIIAQLQQDGLIGEQLSTGRYPLKTQTENAGAPSAPDASRETASEPTATVTNAPETKNEVSDTTAIAPNKDLKQTPQDPAVLMQKARDAMAAGDTAAAEQHIAAAEKAIADREANSKSEGAGSEQSKDQEPTKSYPQAASTRVLGREFVVETPKGEIRHAGTDHAVEAPADYGHFAGTKAADSGRPGKKPVEGVDAYVVGTGNKHFIIDQRNLETGKFDEHKIIANVGSEGEARDIYERGFSDGKGGERLGAITEVPEHTGSKWLSASGWRRKPYSPEWKDTEGTGKPKVTAKVKAPTPDNLVIKGAFDKDGFPARANTVGKARAAEAQIAKVGVHYGELLKDPKVSNDSLAKSLKDKASRAGILARLKKYLADTRGPNLRSQGIGDGFLLQKMIRSLDKTPVSDVAKRNEDWETLVQDMVFLRADHEQPGKNYAEEVRQRRGLEADAGLKSRYVDEEGAADEGDDEHNNIEASALPEELHPVSGGEETGEDVDHGEGEENELNFTPTETTTPKAAIKQESGPKKTTGRILERTEPEVKASARVPKEEKASIDVTKDKGVKQLGETLGVKDAVEVKHEKGQGRVSPADLDRMPRVEPPRPDAPVRRVSPETLAQINARLKAEPLHPADLKNNSHVRDVINNFLGNERGSLDLDAIIDAIKKGGAYLGKGALKLEDMIGKGIFKGGTALGWSMTPTHTQSYRSKLAFKTMDQHEEAAHLLAELLNQNQKLGINDAVNALKYMKSTGQKFNRSELADIADRLEADKNYQAPARIQRMQDANRQELATLQAMDPDTAETLDINHVMHIAKNKAGGRLFNPKYGGDPISGFATNLTGSAVAREFYSLNNIKTSQRWVIHPTDTGYTVHNNGVAQRVNDPNFEAKIGNKLSIRDRQGNIHDFEVGGATMKEIEHSVRDANGGRVEYIHNAALSAVLTNLGLRRTIRDKATSEIIKNSPWFKALSADKSENVPRDKDGLPQYVPLDFHPNFKGMYAHPSIANVLEQHATPGILGDFHGGMNALRKGARLATQSIFLVPTPHGFNVTAHWAIEKGFDWLKPSTYHSLAVDGAQALKSVLTQDHQQDAMRAKGAGLMLGSVLREDQTIKLGKLAGENIRKEPWKWEAMSKVLGMDVSTLAKAADRAFDPVRGVYDGSRKFMWAWNDVLLTQAIKQRQREGMSLDDAIKHVERHIPNYRLAADTLGSRGLTKALEDPAVVAFGPYHSGMYNSLAHVFKGLVKGNAADRMQAAGHLAVLAFGMYVAYPYLDAGVKKLTGNDDASQRRRGPWQLTDTLQKIKNNTGGVEQLIDNAASLSPVAKMAKELYDNRAYNGKPVFDRKTVSDVAKLKPDAMVQAAGQGLGYGLPNLISPVSTAVGAVNAGKKPYEVARDQIMDIKDPSAATQKFERNADKKAQRDYNARMKKPPNFIEKGFNRLVDK